MCEEQTKSFTSSFVKITKTHLYLILCSAYRFRTWINAKMYFFVWTVPLKRQNSLPSFLWTGLYAIPQKWNVRVHDHCLFDCHHFRLSWSSMFLSWLPKWCRMNEICGRSCACTCWRRKSPIIPSDRLQNEPFWAPSHPLLIWKGKKWYREAAIYFPCYHSLTSESDILRGPRSVPRWREMAWTLIFTGHVTASQCFYSLTCASCNRGILPLFIWTQDKATWMKGNSHNQKRSIEDDFSGEGLY